MRSNMSSAKWRPFCPGGDKLKWISERNHQSQQYLEWIQGLMRRMYHDDVMKWKHFSRYWPFVRGIHRWPVNLPHKCQWCGALMFSLICAWLNGWVNYREAGDLRRHHVYYDVIVMVSENVCVKVCVCVKEREIEITRLRELKWLNWWMRPWVSPFQINFPNTLTPWNSQAIVGQQITPREICADILHRPSSDVWYKHSHNNWHIRDAQRAGKWLRRISECYLS